jgi:hypothetical protein
MTVGDDGASSGNEDWQEHGDRFLRDRDQGSDLVPVPGISRWHVPRQQAPSREKTGLG